MNRQFDMQPLDPRDSSLFLKSLPPEIRLEVYSYVFSSTRLAFGQMPMKSTTATTPNTPTRIVLVQVRPAPNSLSLLRVCRQVNQEIGHSWLSQVLFYFGGARTMFDKLTALEPSTLSKLRHMSISGAPPMLSVQSDPPTIKWGWAHVFNALPGLCLDRLTVHGSYTPSARADLSTASQLITRGRGWKELNFIFHNSEVLKLTKDVRSEGYHRTVPRLSRLTERLLRRDGPSGSVDFSQSKDGVKYEMILYKTSTRKFFFHPIDHSLGKQHSPHDITLNLHGEMEMDVRVVVRRGKGVDCTVKPRRENTGDVKVMKRRKRRGTALEDIMVDTYNYVDDYM